ncbi:MAG: pyridoxal-phosphate dependent enzyme [Paracoccaceae bacterium]
MSYLLNPYRGQGLDHPTLSDVPDPSTDAAAAQALVARCPHHGVTPLIASATLAQAAGVGMVYIKDERARMGLGSFKALGAAYVIACDAQAGRAAGRSYVTASAGNHGLSVAAGAAAFGAHAVVYLAETVPESFADRLRATGAEVRRAGAIYEDSMAAATQAAQDDGLTLLSDSSWPGYTAPPHRLMEGYLTLMAEAIDAMPAAPDHIFLQAGVGGLAGACAALARLRWGDGPQITVVEPDAAPAIQDSLKAGAPVISTGPVSAMGRLDCKEPSLIALRGLARDADGALTLTEAQGQAGADLAAAQGLETTASGAAGLSGLLAARAAGLAVASDATVLVILSEGPAE